MKVTNHQVCCFVGFPNCCDKALTCSETTCNEMANFVAKRAVTFLISRGPGFQPLDSIIQRINHYLADKYLGNKLRYPVDRDEKS